MKVGAGLAAVLAVGCIAAPALAAPPDQELAQRYAPVVRIVEQQDPCGHGEPYVPTDVNLLLGNSDVALRGPWDRTNLIKVAPTAADLARGLWGYHLDFPGDALAPGCDYERWSSRLNAGHRPVTYARVVSDPAHPGRLALQYWFFFVYNDFNNKHEGDWEMIQLDFDAPTAQEALATKPALVGYSQHEGAESAHWDDEKLGLLDGTHPVVFPALGSHANYFTSALHLGRSAAQGVGCDDTSGPSRQLRPKVALVPTGKAAYLRAYPWLGFAGRWGEARKGFYNGPTGPNAKLQWTHPLVWADEDWRDKSFTAPGLSTGKTATQFFCGAIATGSSLLTTLVGNPSPFLIGAAVVLALLLWAASRTTWRPSAPLRLERRRGWGCILTAARRMYFSNLRLFLGIGLVFLPLGLLITGVQYLTFRAGGLNGLVAAAGTTNAFVDFLAFGLGLLLTVFGLSVVQSVTAAAMVDVDEGRPVTALGAYRKALPSLPSLLGIVLLVTVSLVLVSLTSIGVLIAAWLIVRWSLLGQVNALERVSGVGGLRRSARLVRGSFWRVASLVLFVTLIALLLGPLCGTLLLFVTHASFNFINLVAGVVDAIVLPYAAIATTYMYFDLRVAKQGEAGDAATADILPAEA